LNGSAATANAVPGPTNPDLIDFLPTPTEEGTKLNETALEGE